VLLGKTRTPKLVERETSIETYNLSLADRANGDAGVSTRDTPPPPKPPLNCVRATTIRAPILHRNYGDYIDVLNLMAVAAAFGGCRHLLAQRRLLGHANAYITQLPTVRQSFDNLSTPRRQNTIWRIYKLSMSVTTRRHSKTSLLALVASMSRPLESGMTCHHSELHPADLAEYATG